MVCPQCQADVYDNRAKNAQRISSGQKPIPDYVCKDKDGCGWKQWPPRQAGSGGGFKGPRAPAGPKWTWGQLSTMYERSLLLAAKHVGKHVPKAAPADVIAATATIFIAATRDGIKADEPVSVAPKPEDEDLYEQVRPPYEPVGR